MAVVQTSNLKIDATVIQANESEVSAKQDMKNPGTIDQLAEYPSVITLPVQWGVQDAFGHVNNVIYFRWYESARIDYMNLLDVECFDVERENSNIGPIIASITCDYKKQLKFPDTVHVGTRVTRFGNSSMQIDHAVFSESHQAVATTGTSICVVFDYTANKPVLIPVELRDAITELEGHEI